jgi:Xaa-Pro aminopeptidase
MSLSLKIHKALAKLPIDGWLIVDFQDGNPLARRILSIPKDKHLTRRYFYFCPKKGSPIKIVHKIEKDALKHLEGEVRTYSSWSDLEAIFSKLFWPNQVIAVEISENSRIPSISFTDGGTVQLLEKLGLQVVSSARLLQEIMSVLNSKQIQTHLRAAQVLLKAVSEAINFIYLRALNELKVTEKDVQQLILEYFEKNGCVTDFPPIVAAGVNSANPHYFPVGEGALIKKGESVLIDLWCKEKENGSIYADITRVCFVGDHPEPEFKKVFFHVLNAQSKAIAFLRERIEKRIPVYGYEVDAVARKEIDRAGYGEYFIHRLGHSIDTALHGIGANLDNYETYDEREIIPGTCYSVEPGIYLPGKFGIRLETNVLVEVDNVSITGGLQEEIYLSHN